MALWKKTQNSFSAGQLDAFIMGRQDIDRYRKGASELTNFLVRRQGCISKRRGTDLTAALTGLLGYTEENEPIAINKIRLVPVVNGDDGRYVIITGGFAFVASREGILMQDGTRTRSLTPASNPFKMHIPYRDNDLNNLCIRQSGDTLFVAHEDYPPAKIMFNEDGTATFDELVFDGHNHKPPTIISVEMKGNDTGECDTKQTDPIFLHSSVANGCDDCEEGQYRVDPPPYNESYGTLVSSSISGPEESMGPGLDSAAAVTWSDTYEKRDRETGTKTTTVVTKSVTHVHATKGETVVPSTKESTSSASSVAPLTTKTIKYCATYVKNGKESVPSLPFSLTYDLPWADSAIVTIMIDRGDNEEDPEYYNIYKDVGNGYGIIGSIILDDIIKTPLMQISCTAVETIEYGTENFIPLEAYKQTNALTDNSLFMRVYAESDKHHVLTDKKTPIVFNTATKLSLSSHTTNIKDNKITFLLDAFTKDQTTGRSLLIPSAAKARLKLVAKATSMFSVPKFYINSSLWIGTRNPDVHIISNNRAINQDGIGAVDIRLADIYMNGTEIIRITSKNIEEYATRFGLDIIEPVALSGGRRPMTFYAIDWTIYNQRNIKQAGLDKFIYMASGPLTKNDGYGNLVNIMKYEDAGDGSINFYYFTFVEGDKIIYFCPNTGDPRKNDPKSYSASEAETLKTSEVVLTAENINTYVKLNGGNANGSIYGSGTVDSDKRSYASVYGTNLDWRKFNSTFFQPTPEMLAYHQYPYSESTPRAELQGVITIPEEYADETEIPNSIVLTELGYTPDGSHAFAQAKTLARRLTEWQEATAIFQEGQAATLDDGTRAYEDLAAYEQITLENGIKAIVVPGDDALAVANSHLRRITFDVKEILKDWQASDLQLNDIEVEFANIDSAQSAVNSANQAAIHGIYLSRSGNDTGGFQDDYIVPDMSITPPNANAGVHFAVENEYPSIVGIHEQRLVFASSKKYPSTIWFSRIGDLYQFHAHDSIREDDAMEISLAATEFPKINNIVNGRDLIILADGGEWIVQPVSGNALTYKTVSAKMQSAIGTARNMDAIKVNTEVVVVERNKMSLRSVNYDYASDSYKSVDLSVLAQDVFMNNRIVSVAYKQHPDSTIECVLEDGTMATLVYMAEQEVIAWSRHTFANGWKARQIVTPKCIINGTTEMMILMERNGEYQLWKVRDDINSSRTRDIVTLDRMRLTSDLTAKEDGEIAIETEDGLFAVGLPIVSDFVSVPPEIDQGATTQFELKNATEIECRVVRSSRFKVRPYGSNVNWQEIREFSETDGEGNVCLINADVRKVLFGANTRDGRIHIRHDQPFPLNILSLSTTYQIEYENNATGGDGQ